MGTVYLTNGHHGLYIRDHNADLTRRFLLDEETLSRPIYNGESCLTAPTQHVIRGALRALMDLPGFNTAISYRVVEHGGLSHIAVPKRVWAEITLEDPANPIISFSHYIGFRNRPYTHLLEWLEEEYPAGGLTDAQFEEFCMGWASPEKWTHLITARIQRKMQGLREDARSFDEQANLIEAALG